MFRLRNRAGFSLVEVALALGIVAFALVTLAGLLSVGMNTTEVATLETISQQVAINVFQRLDLEAMSAENTTSFISPFNPTTGPSAGNPISQTFYFDRNGSYLGTTLPPPSQNPFFLANATISVPASGASPVNPNPYLTSSCLNFNVSNKELRSVSLLVSWPCNPATGAIPPNAPNATYQFLLAKELYLKNLEGAR